MLNPLLLWFLPLALVPIALHLITLYRLRTVDLSTFRFLMDSYIQQRRRMRLLEWLLMALRTLFVLLIIVTVSRPVVERFGFLFGGKNGRDVILIVDASATMSLVSSSGTTSLGRAKDTARQIAAKLAPADHVTLIRAAAKPEVVYRGFLADAPALGQKVDTITADITTGDLPAALAEAVASAPHGPRVIYVISDAQKRAWATLQQHPIRNKLGEDSQLVVMNIGPQNRVVNTAVLGDTPRTARPVVGLPVLLSATVAAGGSDTPTDTRLSVYLDDQVVTQLNLTLQPGQTVTRTVSVVPTHPGLIKGRFEIPSDAFPDDNQFYFCLNVEPHINLLLVTPVADKPINNPALYLGAALRSPLLARGIVGVEETRIAQSLSVKSVTEAEFAEAHLVDVDVIIAADVTMTPPRAALLQKHLAKGGGLLVFSGPHMDPAAWTSQFFPAAIPPGGKSPLVRFDSPTGNLEDESTFRPITTLDLKHPVLTAFDEEKGEFFSGVRLYRYSAIKIELPKPTDLVSPAPKKGKAPKPPSAGKIAAREALSDSPPPTVGSLLRLADQSVVMAETSVGPGRLLLCGFAATPDWSNLPLKSEFVPLLLRSVSQLRPPAQVEAVHAVRPHEPAPIRLAERWDGAKVQAADPANHTQAIDMHRADDRIVGALMKTDTKGYYSFSVNPPPTLAGASPVTLGFTVNLDVDQAEFAGLNKGQVEAVFAPTKIVYLSGSPDDPVLRDQLTHRTEIWRYLIWAMFLVIGIEFMLSTLKPEEDNAEGGGGFRGSVRRFTRRWNSRINRAVGYETIGKT
jgi:hypothetical protein